MDTKWKEALDEIKRKALLYDESIGRKNFKLREFNKKETLEYYNKLQELIDLLPDIENILNYAKDMNTLIKNENETMLDDCMMIENDINKIFEILNNDES